MVRYFGNMLRDELIGRKKGREGEGKAEVGNGLKIVLVHQMLRTCGERRDEG